MSEVYKGTSFNITTSRRRDNVWSAHAELALPTDPNVRVETTDETYSSEEEARQAAHQAAVERIDRERIAKGKP